MPPRSCHFFPPLHFQGASNSFNDFDKFASKCFNDFDKFAPNGFDHIDKFLSNIMKYNVAMSILSIGASFFMLYVIYRCFRASGLPSINIRTSTNGAASTAELTPLLPDTRIQNTTIEKFLDEIAGEKPIRFASQQLAGYTHNHSAKLGAGGFGAVYKGMLPNGLNVAIKVLHGHLENKITEEQFMAEVGTLWRTNHINLIRLFGFCFDANMRALVYEFMEKSSLDKYLFNRRHAVDLPALRAIAVGVARGLRYLHEECQKKIIHYDIKAGNVLLDGNLTPKIVDFGIAQLLSRADAHASVHGLRGSCGYMAPEVGTQATVTEKCDVYSFGMLLFEIAGRRKNMDNDAPDDEKWLPLLLWTKYESGDLMDLVRDCHNLVAADEEQGKETVERMCEVAFLCVQEQPEARPTMSAVVRMLEGEEDIPSLSENPFQFMYGSPTDVHRWTTEEGEESAAAAAAGVEPDILIP